MNTAGRKKFPAIISPEFPLLLVILLAALALYWNSARFPFMNWDDQYYVTENALIRNFNWAAIKEIFSRPYFYLYIPVTLLTFAAEFQIYHFHPSGYHLDNVFLHALNCALVFLFVLRVEKNRSTAFLAALLFAWHPVQVESVVWISQRKTLLSAFWFFLSLLAYLDFREAPGKSKRAAAYAWSLLCFLAACLSKPNIVVLPLLLLLLDARLKKISRQSLLLILPYLAAGLFCSGITSFVGGVERGLTYHGGSFWSSALLMPVILVQYLGLFFAPFKLSLIYNFPIYHSLFAAPVLFSCLLLGGAAALLYWLGRKEPRLWFWGGWSVILLLPFLHFLPSPDLMNDRSLYLPLLGLTGLFFPLFRYRAFQNGVLVICFMLASVNLQRQSLWADPEKIWLDTQAKTQPPVVTPYMNLGTYYLKRGEPEKAVAQYEKALALHKDRAKTYGALGSAYLEMMNLEQAERYLLQAFEQEPDNSLYAMQLGLLYKTRGDFAAALRYFRLAIAKDPKDAGSMVNLANLLAQTGNDREAEEYFLKALVLDPAAHGALFNYGVFLHLHNRGAEAEKYFEKLLFIHPQTNLYGVIQDMGYLNDSGSEQKSDQNQ